MKKGFTPLQPEILTFQGGDRWQINTKCLRKPRSRRSVTGFTLMELLAVIVIIGILATLAVNNYSKVKEDSFDKEAKLNLQMMRSAELTYFMDKGTYYPNAGSEESDIGNINTNLKLSLPTASGGSWSYTAYNNGCVKAKRNGGVRSWYLRVTDNGTNPADPNLDGEPSNGIAPNYTCP